MSHGVFPVSVTVVVDDLCVDDAWDRDELESDDQRHRTG